MKKFHIFLSHDSEDHEIIKQISRELESRGFEVWLDRGQIAPGEELEQKIREGLKNSSVIAIAFGSVEKERGYKKAEYEFAKSLYQDEGVPLIPILLPGWKKDLPIFLQGIKYADFRSGCNTEAVETLIKGIKCGQVRYASTTSKSTAGVRSTPRNASFVSPRKLPDGAFLLSEPEIDKLIKILLPYAETLGEKRKSLLEISLVDPGSCSDKKLRTRCRNQLRHDLVYLNRYRSELPIRAPLQRWIDLAKTQISMKATEEKRLSEISKALEAEHLRANAGTINNPNVGLSTRLRTGLRDALNDALNGGLIDMHAVFAAFLRICPFASGTPTSFLFPVDFCAWVSWHLSDMALPQDSTGHQALTFVNSLKRKRSNSDDALGLWIMTAADELDVPMEYITHLQSASVELSDRILVFVYDAEQRGAKSYSLEAWRCFHMPQDREFVDGIVLRISGDKPLTANSSDEVVARIGRLLTEAGLHESTIEIFLPLDLLALQTERIMIRTLRGQEWPVESRFCVTIRSTERHCRTDFVDDLNFQTFWRQAWQEVERGRPPQSFFRSDLTQLCDSKRADVLRSGCAVPLLPFPPTQNVLQDLIDAGIAVAVWSNDTESIAQHLGSADVFEWKRLVLDFKRKNTTAVSTSLFLDSPSIPPGLGSRSHMLSDWSDFT